MAIQKEKILANGSSGNYWKITREIYNRITKVCEWHITLFKDQDKAALGVSLGISHIFSAKLTHGESIGNRTTIGYEKIKDQASEPAGPLSPPDSMRCPDLVDGIDV